LGEATANMWKSFLEKDPYNEAPELFSYSSKSASDKTVGHAAVMSRATLLLRLSAGSALKLVRAGDLTSEQIEFWWEGLGINRGLWEGSKSGTELLDLWSDISVLVAEAREFQTENSLDQQTFFKIQSALSDVVTGLGGCERVAIWSMTPS
jgi:hypothetical protein